VPTIEIETDDPIQRHLAALRIMSYMVFPDDPELRRASEATFRTRVADWYSQVFATREKKAQIQFVKECPPKSSNELQRALADPALWLREFVFDEFLKPMGGVIEGALALTDSLSAMEFHKEFRRRWFGIHYTGRLIFLMGAINEQRPSDRASLNKALYILSETDGKNEALTALFKEQGYPAVNDSSVKAAWRVFRPVAHLCVAFVATEILCCENYISRGFAEYWNMRPVLHEDLVFNAFCTIAKSAESFVTRFRSHGQRRPLIPSEEIYALPDKMFDLYLPQLPWMNLLDEEVKALEAYRAPI
jgi:hypothetical protein